jgi:predicted esterase
MTPHQKCLAALVPMIALFSAALSAPPARADDDPPADRQKIQREMMSAYQAKNYQKALELCQKLHKMEPDEAEHMYNLACLNCLLDHKDKAYDWIEKAIDAGYDDADHMKADADFRTISGEDRFRKLLKRMREEDQPKADARKKDKHDDDEDDDGDDADDDEGADDAGAKPKKESAAGKGDDDDDDDDDDDEADAEDVNELTRALIRAAEAKDYDKALKLALKANKLADNSLTSYNVACMYSLKKNKDKAFEYLERSVKQGNFPMDLAAQMEQDSDLDNLREDPRYAKIEAMVKSGGGKGAGRAAQGQKVKFEWKVTLPKDRDGSDKPPLVVVLHGAGSNMTEAAKQWKKAAEKVGAVLLTPQGTYKLSDDKYQWGGDMDAIEENVSDAIDKVVAEHKCDKEKIVLAGFSQGGRAAWTLALGNPEMFCGVIPVCGACDATSGAAFDDEELADLRVVILCGADDDEKIVKSNREAAKKLEKKGAKVKLNVYDDVGHAYPENADAEMVKALKFVLGE